MTHRATRQWLPWLLLAASCTSPVRNVIDARFPVALTEPLVHDVLLRALFIKGWRIESDAPHQILASVEAGGHTATIALEYSATAYSIYHVNSSAGLRYDGHSIHKRYNNWIKKLERIIDREFLRRMEDGSLAVRPSLPPPPSPSPQLPPPPPQMPPPPAEAVPAVAPEP